MEIVEGQTVGFWTVIKQDDSKQNYKARGKRWICECKCGAKKSILGKYLKNGKSQSCGCKKKDITRSKIGLKQGRLTIVDVIYGYNDIVGATYKCECECGNIVYIHRNEFAHRISCGCSRLVDNMVGEKFGKLTVIKMLPHYGRNGLTFCECKCECGNTTTVSAKSLRTGNTKSCGCVHSPDLTGMKFCRLTVIGLNGISESNQKIWECMCDCGNVTYLSTNILLSGHTSSCGCMRSESRSRNEIFISKVLRDNSISFDNEYIFKDCIGAGGKPLRFDFYLPDYNTCIEYDGIQHEIPVDYFGGIESFNIRRVNDEIKNKYCERNNIRLIRLPYTYDDKTIEDTILHIIQDPVTTTA